MREHSLEQEVMAVMEDLADALGDETIVFASGGLAHLLDSRHVTGGGLGRPEDFPEHPNVYDFAVVTPKIIAMTYGEIRQGGHHREHLKVLARKSISEVNVIQAPGEKDEYGNVSQSHDVAVTFSNGNLVELPRLDQDLTPEGVARLAALIPKLYQDLVA